MSGRNRLFFGDNLPFLRNREFFPAESVDLIYLDPPFNSSQNYNILYRDETGTPSTAQIKAFSDTWRWDESAALALHEINSGASAANSKLVGLINALEEALGHSPMFAYLMMMAVRLVELHNILKPTGSLFLHCDPTASHYLKIILDCVFRPELFRNEIVWHYRRWTASSKRLQRMHDIILFYAKSDYVKINPNYVAPTQGQVRKHERGWDRNTVLIDGIRQPQLIVYDHEKVQSAVAEGRINLADFARVVRPKLKMTVAPDVWYIDFINSQARERLGYQTQKPIALLKRILQIASNPGDLILDPFCGCGTTIDAAETLNRENPNDPPRRWAGIDVTHLAIDLIKFRLASRFGIEPAHYTVIGEPVTVEEAYALANENRYQFQYWALGLVGARPWGDERRKGADKGIDGYRTFLHGVRRTYSRCIVQVKSGRVNPSQIRDLKGTMEREDALMAVFISLEPPTQDMRIEAASAGFYHSEIMNRDYPRIQILTIEELLAHPNCLRIPPGGELLPAPKFTAENGNQADIF